MNDRLKANLAKARAELLNAQMLLHRLRQLGCEPSGTLIPTATARLYRALDRAWEAQCMAQGVFG